MATFKNEVSKNAIVTSQSNRLGKVFTRVKCSIQPEFILVFVHEVTKREYHYYPPPPPSPASSGWNASPSQAKSYYVPSSIYSILKQNNKK